MSSVTLQDLKRQIADLQKQADELREQEMGTAIETVKELVATFGLTAEQIGFASVAKTRARAVASPRGSGAGVAKYADPNSDKTWTGHGKPPRWIADVKDRTPFLIKPIAGAPNGAAAARKRAAKKVQAKK